MTNGDMTVPRLRGTGLAQEIIPWRDVLHEGDVFAERDRTLAGHRDGEYVLWFEADLYDQLQIVQILAGPVALNGIDRWIGGVHLSGTDVPWRWDEGTESVTAHRGR